jgi:DNA-binding IscR family transcriptional regulator
MQPLKNGVETIQASEKQIALSALGEAAQASSVRLPVSESRSLSPNLNRAIDDIRTELDDHRQTINENTNELQSNHAYLGQLAEKLDVLGRQLALVTEALQKAGLLKAEAVPCDSDLEPLTPKEKEVFQALYVLSESQTCVTYKDIARKLGTSERLVADYISELIEKRIPISKNYMGSGVVLLHLDESFRQRQSRENIVGINPVLTYWVR